MDRNGYRPSILATTAGECYLCHRQCDTVRHEVYYGTCTRALSKRYGLWVDICPCCHEEVHADPEGGKAKKLRTDAEQAFTAEGHSQAEFIRLFVTGCVKWWEIE